MLGVSYTLRAFTFRPLYAFWLPVFFFSCLLSPKARGEDWHCGADGQRQEHIDAGAVPHGGLRERVGCYRWGGHEGHWARHVEVEADHHPSGSSTGSVQHELKYTDYSVFHAFNPCAVISV